MDEEFKEYGSGHADSSAYIRLELFRQWQRRRIVAASVGDMFFALARGYASLRPRHIPRAIGLTVRAIEWYSAAGLRTQGRVAWRWAQAIHRARWRESLT